MSFIKAAALGERILEDREARGTELRGKAEIAYITVPNGSTLPEKAGGYPALAVLNAKTRVIECAAGIQWIVQRRKGEQWHGRHFCRTKEALLRCAAGELAGARIGIPPSWPCRIGLGARRRVLPSPQR